MDTYLNFTWKGYVIMPYKKEYHQLTCSRCNQVFEVLTPAYLRRLKDPKYGSICPTCRRKIQQEEMTPEERKRRAAKAKQTLKKTLENMDPEQRAAWTQNKRDKVKKAWAEMDEDHKKELSILRSQQQKDHFANMTDEQLAEAGRKISVGKKLAFANMTKEEREANRERMREERKVYWASRTDEQREAIINQLKKNARDFWDDESNKEKQDMIIDNLKKGVRDYWDNISEEDKQQSLDRLNAGYRNWRENLTDDQKQKISDRVSVQFKDRWTNMPDDQREKISARQTEFMLKKMKDPEYRKQFIDRMKEGHSKWWNSLSDDERRETIQKQHEWFTNMTEEQKNEFYHRHFSKLSTDFTKVELHFSDLFNGSRWAGLFTLKHQDLIEQNGIKHVWDYGIYDKTGKLVMLIDIDGALFHGDICEYNDYATKTPIIDYYRQFTIPDGVKCNILSDLDLDNEFDLAMKELDLTYDQYLERRFNAIRNYGFPFPNRTSKQLRLSFDSLRKFVNSDIDLEKYHRFIFIGNWLIDQFHPSIYYCNRVNSLSPYDAIMNDVALKYLIDTNTIYRGVINYNKLLQGMTMSDIAPVVDVFSPGHAVMLIRQYLSEFDTIYDPFSSFSSRMLGALACGKSYIGNDISMIMTNESIQMYDWLKTNYPDIPDVKISCADVNDQYGEYPCLFTCVPYSNYEQWIDASDSDMTADDWIDLCMDHFKCKRYVFIVDYTEKYTDNLVGVINNVLGSGIDQYVIKIDAP